MKKIMGDKNKTSKEDFEYFKSRCKYWVDYFGLKQWKVYYYHQKIDKNNFGDCSTHYSGKIASIRLNKECGEFAGKDKLDETAFHEVCEILLSPLSVLAGERTWDKTEYESRHHEIIRTLENVIFVSSS